MPRWRVGCDRCEAGGWIGPRPAGDPGSLDAWCEGCQSAHALALASARVCPRCGTSLSVAEPRFTELYGELQNLAAVLAAWAREPELLAAILPDRPRLLTDLTPPAPAASDGPAARAALAALESGAFRDARQRLAALCPFEPPAGAPVPAPHWWLALGIACERTGDPVAADAAYARALVSAPGSSAAHLNRGALRARRGDWDGARDDFARAGDRQEARWDRAATQLLETVARAPGLPAAEVIDRARREAGAASDFWSDHTVGRLLWTLLAERAAARAVDHVATPDDAQSLRAAAELFEHDTFWDRAMIVLGYARLGMAPELESAAFELASDRLRSLRTEPFARGSASRWIAPALSAASEALAARQPKAACAALQTLMSDQTIAHYRVPCAACGVGTLGIAEFEEDEPDL